MLVSPSSPARMGTYPGDHVKVMRRVTAVNDMNVAAPPQVFEHIGFLYIGVTQGTMAQYAHLLSTYPGYLVKVVP